MTAMDSGKEYSTISMLLLQQPLPAWFLKKTEEHGHPQSKLTVKPLVAQCPYIQKQQSLSQ